MAWHGGLTAEIEEMFDGLVCFDWADLDRLTVFNPEANAARAAEWARENPLRRKAITAKANASPVKRLLDSRPLSPERKARKAATRALNRERENARRRARRENSEFRERENAQRRARHQAKKAACAK